jgi:transcription antitermination factor NusG
MVIRRDDATACSRGAASANRGQREGLARGPFADIAAIFAEKHDERRCRILLSMLGKQHSVLVLSNDLEKVA